MLICHILATVEAAAGCPIAPVCYLHQIWQLHVLLQMKLIAVCVWLLTCSCQRGYTLTFAFSLLATWYHMIDCFWLPTMQTIEIFNQ